MRYNSAFLGLGFCLAFLLPSFAVADDDLIATALDNITTLVRPQQVGYATIYDGNKFVQCRRLPGGEMRCEAAGTLMQPSLERVMTRERMAFLETQGWAVDPAFGLYQQTFPADRSLGQLADAIRMALVQGYAAKLKDISIGAQWVDDVTCPPRLNASQSRAGSINTSKELASAASRTCVYMPDPKKSAFRMVTSVDELMQIYGKRLTGEVQRLRINAHTAKHIMVDAGIGYVQCAPQFEPIAIYCEAASIESWPPLAAVLTPDRIAWLHAAGFNDPGREPNYWKIFSPEKFKDEAIARQILEILREVYGFQGPHSLEIKAN